MGIIWMQEYYVEHFTIIAGQWQFLASIYIIYWEVFIIS